MKPIGIYVTGIHQSLIKLPQQIETQEKAVHILWNVLSFRLGKLAWWRHQMEKKSALLALCAGNSSITNEFPVQRPVTRSFDVFFDLSLNKRLSKQSWGWWFDTPSRSLWRYYNEIWILPWVALKRRLINHLMDAKILSGAYISKVLYRRDTSSLT